jgi:hypothetical protein
MYVPGRNSTVKDNILFSRQQLRVTEFPCEVVTYRYAGRGAVLALLLHFMADVGLAG